MSAYHKSLTPDRWREYDLPTQILMVACEVHRAGNALRRGDRAGARLAYARALELVDLTAAVHRRPALLKELLRWRTLAAAEYLRPVPCPAATRSLLRILLLYTGPSARQIEHLELPA
jgi:hypothetical protein